MRMSVKKNDSGYHKRAHSFKVLLDGKYLQDCFTADEDKGYVLINKRDKNGQLLLNKDKTELITEKIFGKIEIMGS